MDDAQKYKQSYGLGVKLSRNKARKAKERRRNALNHALDIRKFEIELYWKRTTYFWTLIAAMFVAFVTILEKVKDNEITLLLTACTGFILSLSWFLVNKGSKKWQENWENHVFLLEDDYMGALYKSVLSRSGKKDGNCIIDSITKPSNYSVSKINQFVSLYITLIWGGILLYLLSNSLGCICIGRSVPTVIVVISVTCFIFVYLLICHGKSSKTDYEPSIQTFKATLLNKK